MATRTIASGSAAAILALLLATPASAQAIGSQRPFKGLFGGAGGPGSSDGHLLSLTVSVAEAYDSDTPLDAGVVIDPTGTVVDGFSTMLNGALDYRWQGKRASVGASSMSTVRYEADAGQFRTLSHSGGIGLSARLAKGTTVFANQSAAYSPWYLYSLFPSLAEISPGDALPAAPDYSTSRVESYAYTTTVSLAQDLTPRTALKASGDLRYTDFAEETAARRDQHSRSMRVSFDRRLAQTTGLSVGYRYRVGDFGYVAEGNAKEHGLDVRFDHVRRFSATRRAYISLNIGSSASEVPVSSDPAEPLEEGRGVVGSASVGYDFGRSWQARTTFNRGVEFLPGLTEPVRREGVSAALTGLVTSRIDLTASAAYSNGQGAMRSSGLSFETYTGSVMGRVGLTRTLAAHAEYLYYLYDFSEGASLLPGLPPQLTRHGVRVGITVWVPVVRR